MAIQTFQTCTQWSDVPPVSLPVSSSPLCPFRCGTKGENNEGGRCSVWPDNVRVFKGPNEAVSVLTCEGGRLSRSVSTLIPVLLNGTAALLLSQHAGPPLTYIHPLSPNRQTSRCVSRRGQPLCWDSSKLHKVRPASTHEFWIINKEPTGGIPAKPRTREGWSQFSLSILSIAAVHKGRLV